ncbi:formate dehydrogenase subunit gamma [Paucibacter sp. KBW04]|uniref:formate dehydrogenase subunit gamma n=1 Tax=Paucibacter sp. KBW04 TaxID=2153361 RepID=UPI000F58C399|nr:formate dehydrogenase subunit gamma [Paucibacter sp. KBW04]RQO61300.1 formate dehydrogenase subunit gamma [Paucibacter sp. KBW04]
MHPILAVPDRRITGPSDKSSSLSPEQSELLADLIRKHQTQPGGLLPLLHAVQDLFSYVPSFVVPDIALALNLSRAEVHGVLSYYHFFRTEPPGHHVVQICRAEACQACGADALLHHAEQTLNCTRGHTRDDGAVSLEEVFCLGLCASSPALQIDGQVHARVTEQRFNQLLQTHCQIAAPADLGSNR